MGDDGEGSASGAAAGLPSPYGVSETRWVVDGDYFYRYVDEAFDQWYGSAGRTLGDTLPELLTAAVDDRPHRAPSGYDRRPTHPDVAAEVERLVGLGVYCTAEEARSVQFYPSPLAAFREGFEVGVSRERSAYAARSSIGFVRGVLGSAIERHGADRVRALVDQLTAAPVPPDEPDLQERLFPE